VWFNEPVTPDEVAFDAGVFLLTKETAKRLKGGIKGEPIPIPTPKQEPIPGPQPGPGQEPSPGAETKTLRLVGTVPSEVWNRLGTKLIPKLRSGAELKIGVEFSVTVDGKLAPNLEQEIRQILEDLGLAGTISLERS